MPTSHPHADTVVSRRVSGMAGSGLGVDTGTYHQAVKSALEIPVSLILAEVLGVVKVAEVLGVLVEAYVLL